MQQNPYSKEREQGSNSVDASDTWRAGVQLQAVRLMAKGLTREEAGRRIDSDGRSNTTITNYLAGLYKKFDIPQTQSVESIIGLLKRCLQEGMLETQEVYPENYDSRVREPLRPYMMADLSEIFSGKTFSEAAETLNLTNRSLVTGLSKAYRNLHVQNYVQAFGVWINAQKEGIDLTKPPEKDEVMGPAVVERDNNFVLFPKTPEELQRSIDLLDKGGTLVLAYNLGSITRRDRSTDPKEAPIILVVGAYERFSNELRDQTRKREQIDSIMFRSRSTSDFQVRIGKDILQIVVLQGNEEFSDLQKETLRRFLALAQKKGNQLSPSFSLRGKILQDNFD